MTSSGTSSDHESGRRTARDVFLAVVSTWATTLRVAVLVVLVVVSIWALSLDVTFGPVRVESR